jgi:hypothetical protein
MTVIVKVRRVLKNTAMACIINYFGCCLQGLRETMKTTGNCFNSEAEERQMTEFCGGKP